MEITIEVSSKERPVRLLAEIVEVSRVQPGADTAEVSFNVLEVLDDGGPAVERGEVH
jgi:hypothetical protein